MNVYGTFAFKFGRKANLFWIAGWAATLFIWSLGGGTSNALAQTPAALPGDSLVVATTNITTFTQIENLPVPSAANQKYCGLVQLAPGFFAEAYVPTAAERQGNYSAFAGLLVDPITTTPPGYVGALPFPGGFIPASRLPNPFAWRISSGSGSSAPGCARFPSGFIPFTSIYYVTPKIGDTQILITSASPNAIAGGFGSSGSGNFTLTLKGRGFLLASDIGVLFDGNSLVPSTNNGVELTVSVLGGFINEQSPTVYSVSVTSQIRNLTSNTIQIPRSGSSGPFLNVVPVTGGTGTSGATELHLSGTVGISAMAGSLAVSSISTTLGSTTLNVQASVAYITPTPHPWLTVTPTSAITPATLSVIVNAVGLAPGLYSALINLTGTPVSSGNLRAAATGSTDTKTVAVTANISGQSIIPVPSFLSFSYLVGGGVTLPPQVLNFMPFNLSNLTNGAPHTYAAAVSTQSGGNWLLIDNNAGNLSSPINVSVNPSNLSAGSYTGLISVVPDGLQSASVSAGVSLVVENSPDAQISFGSYLPGGSLPSQQTLPLGAQTDESGFTSNLVSEMNWLQVNPQNGETPQNLQFSVDPVAAGLSPGSHVGLAAIVDQNNPGNVLIIKANLSVVSPLPPPPAVMSVKNAASEESFIGPNEFVEIKGSNLANAPPVPWTGAIQNGILPTSLNGASVTVNGQPAYVSYAGPLQINVLVPPGLTGNTANVVVNSNGTTSQFTAALQPVAPAFFEFDFASRRVAATHVDNTPVGYQGSRPAAPNETIQVWATGFGDTVAPIPVGQLVSASSPLKITPTVTVGGMTAGVPFAGLVAAGLYQINVTIPANAPNGDLAIQAFLPGVQTMAGVIVAVQR